MKIGRGGYVYPTDWDGSRRLCATEAVAAALSETGREGATLAVLAKRTGELLGRGIPTSIAGRLLISAGAVYDADAMMWSLSETDDIDTFDGTEGTSAAASNSGDVFPPSAARATSGEPALHGV
ncbi:MAG: hypothetical protein ABI478_13425 [Propionivibrio sp.]